MLINHINEIVQKQHLQNSNHLYIKSTLKEYLQIIILSFIYTHKTYKSNLIFTGGTCLRHFYGLERLSEDLDFDIINSIDSRKLADNINEYFNSVLQYKDLSISIKQQNKQILLKFPILQKLGLATKSESDLLYIKIDLSKVKETNYQTEKTAKSAFGYNFVALHYNLSSLFSGKINAILTRNLLTGRENRRTIKGRDFYDLLWYLKRDTKLNLQLIREKLKKPTLSIIELKKEIDEKVNLACTTNKTDFKNDLLPFINNSSFIQDYVDNYKAEYNKYVLSTI